MCISKATLSILLASLFVTACTEVNEPVASHPLVFKIKATDREISIDQMKKLNIENLKGSVATADFFEHLESIQDLNSQKGANSNLKAKQAFADFYTSPNTSSQVKFEESPYADFIISKSKDDVLAATSTIDVFFNEQRAIIENTIAISTQKFIFPKGDISISESFQYIADYISLFEEELLKSKAEKTVKSAVAGGLYQRFWLKLPGATNIVSKMEAAEDVQSTVTILRSLVQELEVELTPEQEQELQSAADLGQMLNQELDAQSAFGVLIHVWELMTPKEREETFGEISPELNSFLRDKNSNRRDCLKRPDCASLTLSFARKFFILPKIKKFGIEKLRETIEFSATDRIKSQTSSIATAFVSEVPGLMQNEINSEITKEFKRYSGYRANYDQFLRGELKKWFVKTYSSSTLPALEATSVNIKATAAEINVSSATSEESSIITSADALGAALSSSPSLIGENRSAQMLGLTRINQLLAHGGFSLYSGKSFPSLMRELFGRGESRSQNIENFFSGPSLFAMPTPVRVKNGFQLSEGVVPENFIIRSQARLLRGFSKMMLAFHDKKFSSLGQLMNKIKIKDIVGDLPTEEIKASAFPSEAFLAVSLGNAAAVLTSLKASGTPLFIMCQDRTLIWADKSVECVSPTALAGVVDIVKNKRQMQVDTISQAEFLESLIEFLIAADTTKNTQSEYLIKKTDTNKSPIEELNASLPELRNLALGLANLLSHVLESREGQFYVQYDLKLNKPSLGATTFSVQIAGIRALLKASEYFNLKTYKMSAINAYYYMNRELWDESTGFYNNGSGRSVTRLEVATAASSLRPLLNEAFLDSKSRIQLQSLMDVWTAAL